ncbi:uncharacterized protein PFB0765w-like [Micropterus salmoides]|uniref:uncharacterized protein PFB0765w-like n=1 Tax=Micropterus salmoides TaxID=27706 RepID=UPI0018EE3FD4|nr:uncharacterized protein PFB0765w-like [Micropterus salmoides]
MNAVGLVLKATENRLDERLRYIFDSVVSLFGKNMEKNIVALLTHSDGLTPENVLKALDAANIKIAKDKENEPVHFMFNNRQDTGRTKKNKDAFKGPWDVTMEGMDQFTEFLEKTAPQNLMATIEVLKARIRLTACIQNLKERVEFTEQKQREIQQTQETLKKHEEEKKRNEEFLELKQRENQQTQEALKKHEEEMKRNEEFIVEFDEVYKVKQKIDERRWWWLWLNYGGAVCCTVCEENCHYPGCT